MCKTMSHLEEQVTSNIGKTIAAVVMLQDWDNRDVGFRYEFTDGTSLEVSSRGSDEGTWVTANAS